MRGRWAEVVEVMKGERRWGLGRVGGEWRDWGRGGRGRERRVEGSGGERGRRLEGGESWSSWCLKQSRSGCTQKTLIS